MATKCPACGVANLDDAKFCARCGEAIRLRAIRTNAAVPEGTNSRRCTSCGRALNSDFLICPYCGKDFRTSEQEVKAEPEKPLSSLLGVAALLLLLGGVFSLAGLAILHQEYFGFVEYQVSPLEKMEMVVWATSAIIGMGGAYFVVFRRDLGIAITAGILCAVAGFPVYYVGAIPGTAAVILLVLSREKFP